MNTLSKAPESVSIRPRRSLAGLVAHVVVEESHTDDLEVTEHPVERGAPISDHAYLKPAEVTLRLGWSPAGDGASGSQEYVVEMYAKLLEIRAKREPFDLVTGKRVYRNMVMTSIATTTDEKTENILLVTVTCREVIIVETVTTTVPPRSRQRNPGKTGATEERGTKQPERMSAGAALLGGILGTHRRKE